MQQDLFSSPSPYDAAETSGFSNNTKTLDSRQNKSVAYGLDKLLIGVCLLVISYVVVFSWGVERGRKQIKVETEAKVEKLHNEISRLTTVAQELVRTPMRRMAAENIPVPADASNVQTVSLFREPIVELPQDQEEAVEPLGMSAGAAGMKKMAAPLTETLTLGDKKFTLQLATYVTTDRAEEQIQKLKKLGYDAFVIPSGKYFQVCIEKVQTKSMAQSLKSKIQNETHLYPDAYIRNLPL